MSERTSLQRKPLKRGWYLVFDYRQFPCNGDRHVPSVVYVDPDGSYHPHAEPHSEPRFAGTRTRAPLPLRAFVYLGDEPENLTPSSDAPVAQDDAR